jgi:hypothetical protein
MVSFVPATSVSSINKADSHNIIVESGLKVVRLYLKLFVGGLLYYLRCLCLLTYSGV